MLESGPVLGIDPGSRATGWGVITEGSDGTCKILSVGVIRTRTSDDFPARLRELYAGIVDVIERFSPVECAIEDVFVARNAKSALKLGHARASVMMAAMNSGLRIFEYTPAQIKKAVVGYGGADKGQVQKMVSLILGTNRRFPKDASDALAVALCHIQTSKFSRFVTVDIRARGMPQ